RAKPLNRQLRLRTSISKRRDRAVYPTNSVLWILAGDAVQFAPVSSQIPFQQEFFRETGTSVARNHDPGAEIRWSTARSGQFPTQANREISCTNRELAQCIQGISHVVKRWGNSRDGRQNGAKRFEVRLHQPGIKPCFHRHLAAAAKPEATSHDCPN